MNKTKEPKSVETEHNGNEVDYENRNKSASTNDSTNEEQIPEAAAVTKEVKPAKMFGGKKCRLSRHFRHQKKPCVLPKYIVETSDEYSDSCSIADGDDDDEDYSVT